VHDGSARSKDALPFLASRTSEPEPIIVHGLLCADECDGKSGDSMLPIVELGACDACDVACILVHYKYDILRCCMSVRSVVHKGERPKW
jgi:hypothetical protein